MVEPSPARIAHTIADPPRPRLLQAEASGTCREPGQAVDPLGYGTVVAWPTGRRSSVCEHLRMARGGYRGERDSGGDDDVGDYLDRLGTMDDPEFPTPGPGWIC